MATPSKFKNAQEAKEAGWFSRRHQTNGALEAERAKRKNKKEKHLT